MVKRFLSVVLVVSASLAGSAWAQEMSPEQQAMTQQLQGMAEQIRANMENSGIDIQQFGQQMQQQMQSGTFDPQAMQQMLIEQGIVSQDMMNQMTGTVRTLALSTIRTQLGSSDDEWSVLQPKILRVVNAMSDVDQSQVNRLAGRMFNNQQGNSEMDGARKALKAAVDDPNTSEERIQITLSNWRRIHARAKIELADAQGDLIRILTLRQEGVLLNIGVL